MKIKILSVVMAAALVLLAGCQSGEPSSQTSSVEADIAAEHLLSDEKLIDRALYLLEPSIHPISWWIGAGIISLEVWEAEYVDPLEDTPEGSTFYQVLRFNSITEMKRATEQVMTKEYTQTNLYPFLEINKQFLERDGKLYFNTSGGCGMWPFRADSAKVLSKNSDTVLLSVTFIGGSGDEESVKEVEMKFEDQTWKLNSSPYTEGPVNIDE